MKAAEHALGTIKREPELERETIAVKVEDSAASILRPTAPEFQPSDSATTVETGDTGEGGLVMGERERTETTRGSSDGTATRSDPSHGLTGPRTDHVATPMGVRSAETRPDVPTQEATATRIIRPSPYDGRSPWDAYKTQFEMLADLNRWTDTEKATFLAINLKGAALSVLGNLPQRSRSDYAALTAALDSRFGVAHQAELNRARLRSRKRQRGEGLPELAEDIERLARLAYPDADPSMLEVLGKDQFIDALLNDDSRLRIRQMRPTTLRAALEHALELESYQLANQQTGRAVRETRLGNEHQQQWSQQKEPRAAKGGEELLQECLQLLQQCAIGSENSGRGSKLSNKPRKKNKEDITCWRCKQKGHIQRNCTQQAVVGRDGMPPSQQQHLNGQ